MMETLKSMRRRWIENEEGIFPWKEIFTGRMLDIGCGPCKLPFENCVGFDTSEADVNGDANHLSTYFAAASFDLIHASQCLEHLHDPEACVRDWLTLLAPQGHLVVTIPDLDLYEKRRFPSAWNGDHKAVFSTWRKGFPGITAPFIHVPTMLARLDAEVRLCRLVATNYDWTASEDIDQSFREEAGIECWVEFCLRKL